jgi:4-alpha-glucanotransferase
MLSRLSGVLLPVFSLPSRFGIGDLGPGAFRFVDFLHAAGQRIWQILPLNPTEGAFGHSPYHSVSCFAFNPLLISPELLAQEGWVDPADLSQGGVRLQAPPAGEGLPAIPRACARCRL